MTDRIRNERRRLPLLCRVRGHDWVRGKYGAQGWGRDTCPRCVDFDDYQLAAKVARLAAEAEAAESTEDDGLPLPEGTTVTRGFPLGTRIQTERRSADNKFTVLTTTYKQDDADLEAVKARNEATKSNLARAWWERFGRRGRPRNNTSGVPQYGVRYGDGEVEGPYTTYGQALDKRTQLRRDIIKGLIEAGDYEPMVLVERTWRVEVGDWKRA